MLTPLDIQNKDFSREFRGYSMQEVDEFLNLVIDGYEMLYKENMESKDKITKLSESLKHYQSLETTLQSALVVAQSASEQVQKNAEEKAENIIADANNKAKEIIANSFEEVKKLEYRYEELKRGIEIYRAKMTALLESQMGLLKQVETSDETLVEIQGIKEAVEVVEDVTRQIEEQKQEIENEAFIPVNDTYISDYNEFEIKPANSVEDNVLTAENSTKNDFDSDIPDFNTQEIEYLLNENK